MLISKLCGFWNNQHDGMTSAFSRQPQNCVQSLQRFSPTHLIKTMLKFWVFHFQWKSNFISLKIHPFCSNLSWKSSHLNWIQWVIHAQDYLEIGKLLKIALYYARFISWCPFFSRPAKQTKWKMRFKTPPYHERNALLHHDVWIHERLEKSGMNKKKECESFWRIAKHVKLVRTYSCYWKEFAMRVSRSSFTKSYVHSQDGPHGVNFNVRFPYVLGTQWDIFQRK